MLMLHRLQCWIPFYRRTPQPWKFFASPWNISFSESTMFLVDTEDPRFLNDSTIYPCHKIASICCQQSCYWLKHVLVTCAKRSSLRYTCRYSTAHCLRFRIRISSGFRLSFLLMCHVFPNTLTASVVDMSIDPFVSLQSLSFPTWLAQSTYIIVLFCRYRLLFP